MEMAVVRGKLKLCCAVTGMYFVLRFRDGCDGKC